MDAFANDSQLAECGICGDPHAEASHGEPLVMRELHQRTLDESVYVFAQDVESLVERVPAVGDITFAGRVYRVLNEYDSVPVDDRDPSEALDDLDAILTDAGYFPLTDGDQGTWTVYGPSVERLPSGA